MTTRTKVYRDIYDEQVAILRQKYPADIELQREALRRLNALVEPVDVMPPTAREVDARADALQIAHPEMSAGRATAVARRQLQERRGLEWQPERADLPHLTSDEQSAYFQSPAFRDAVPDGNPTRAQGAVFDAIDAAEVYAKEVRDRKATIRAMLEPEHKKLMEAAKALGDADDPGWLDRIGTELSIGSLDALVEREYQKQYVPKVGMRPENMTLGQLKEYLRQGGELTAPPDYVPNTTTLGAISTGVPITAIGEGGE